MDVKTFVIYQRDRAVAIGCVLIGAIVLLLGWVGISGTALVHEQLSYVVSGAMVGIALVGIGCTTWISADLRDEWRKLDRLEGALREALAGQVLVTVPLTPHGATSDDDRLVATLGGPPPNVS